MSSELAAQGLSEAPAGKLVHLALPVRLTHVGGNSRGTIEMACTYDIHPRGARLLSSCQVQIGDRVQIERGRSKAVYQIIWTAAPDGPLRGQFTVECVDQSRAPWEDELRQTEEQYLPILSDAELKALSGPRRGEQNKRRRPRFSLEGAADMVQLGGDYRIEGKVQQLSELGCRILATDSLQPGSELSVQLNVLNVSMALRGQVKHVGGRTGMGVEFTEIRRGDRPLLSYVLSALAAEQKPPEQILRPLAVAG